MRSRSTARSMWLRLQTMGSLITYFAGLTGSRCWSPCFSPCWWRGRCSW